MTMASQASATRRRFPDFRRNLAFGGAFSSSSIRRRTMQQTSEDTRPEKTPDEARQAIETGYMRYVLGVSLALAVIAMVVAFLLV